MSNPDAPWLTAIVVTLAGTGVAACTAILHSAASRQDVVGLVPIAVLWGLVVTVAGRRLGVGMPLLLALVAMAVRAPLVGSPPHLSDDLYRYLFEGIAMNAGFNPFITPPQELVGLADPIRERVNNPEITTIYPPLALAWFRLLAVGGSIPFVQFATATVDVSTVLAIAWGSGRSWPAWVYALHPLAVLESTSGAHIDVVAISATAWGIAAWRRGWLGPGWLGVAAGAGLKVLPVVFLPTLWRRLRHRGAWLLGTVAVGTLLAAPVLGAGPDLFAGFGEYAGRWAFNGFVFSWLDPESPLSRPLLVGIGAIVGVSAWLRESDPGRLWATVGAAFVLLSPTVHPWYALWAVVPGLLNARVAWAAASVWLLGSYSVLAAFDPATGLWNEAPWLWWLTWPPTIATLLACHYRSDWTATAP